MATAYRVESDLDPDRNVVLSADRAELTDGESLNKVLELLETKLRQQGLEDRTVFSVKNIVLEMAGNTVLHGTGHREKGELLVVSRHDNTVRVWLFGHGRRSQLDRLSRVIKEVQSLAKPPVHRETLLKRRNSEMFRKSSSPASNEHGGGTGIMTIAALSSQPLWFVLGNANGGSSFALRSTV